MCDYGRVGGYVGVNGCCGDVGARLQVPVCCGATLSHSHIHYFTQTDHQAQQAVIATPVTTQNIQRLSQNRMVHRRVHKSRPRVIPIWAELNQSTIFQPYLFSTATGWTVRGSNPGGDEITRTRPDRHWGPNSLLYNGYRVSFPRVRRPQRSANHPNSISSRCYRTSRAIHLPLWAFVACYRIKFTFTFNIFMVQQPLCPGSPHYRGSTITLRHTTVGRTPVDE